MCKNVNLLEGPIFPSMSRLAFPIMVTSLVQMAYNMIDMIWIGRLGSDAVAAVGAAGMYMWLANGIATLSRMGGQVKLGHAIGAGDYNSGVSYGKSALQLGAILGILYGIIAVAFADSLIGFFKLNSQTVIADAKIYLLITCGFIVFSFISQIFTGLMTAMGNSKISLFATATGLIINMVLDPILIFGVGPIPKMGVMGAAIATVVAQAIVMLLFIITAVREKLIFSKIKLFSRPEWGKMRELIRIGLPVSIQSMLFTGMSMIIARMIAGFGDTAIAVQKVGSQIESIAWMTAEGFAAAVNSFMAQNMGAGKYGRLRQGYRTAMVVVAVWGIFCTVLLICWPEGIFRIFIPEAEVLPMGVDYLRILGISQLFMCVEIATAGAFSGLGRTLPPSIISIVFTAIRIPLAMILSATALGLNGIWWSITISTIIKGIVMVSWFYVTRKKTMRAS